MQKINLWVVMLTQHLVRSDIEKLANMGLRNFMSFLMSETFWLDLQWLSGCLFQSGVVVGKSYIPLVSLYLLLLATQRGELKHQHIQKLTVQRRLYNLKTFKTTFYSSSQLIIFVNNEYKAALKVFKRVKHLWVLKFHKNNAFSAVISNDIIFEKFQPIGV